MRDVETHDAGLVEESNLFSKHFATYWSWCEANEQGDLNESLTCLDIQVMPMVVGAKRQWRQSLRHLSRCAAYSETGMLAKGKALHEYFTQFPVEDIEAQLLISSLVSDLDLFSRQTLSERCSSKA